jgi:hypothetical protein
MSRIKEWFRSLRKKVVHKVEQHLVPWRRVVHVIRYYHVAHRLHEHGMLRYISPAAHNIICDYADLETLEEFNARVRALHAIFPRKVHFTGTQIWSPHDDCVIFEKSYKVKCVPVKLWFRTTVQQLPKELLADGCRFEPKQTTETSYTLVCPSP